MRKRAAKRRPPAVAGWLVGLDSAKEDKQQAEWS